MEYLLYIGKSNNNFTHNLIYDYKCYGRLVNNTNVIVHTNSKNLICFNNNPLNRKKKKFLEKKLDYFLKNFKFLNEIDYLRYSRRQKLLKIKKII
ncbi:hypothetical protein M0Q97_05810 [Candidatus Dojkabacteria bacterium]|jgi:hypothetical protein|nr:hypothetical protein [Candidatus Dojkabacteria bacterium]